MDTDNTFPIDKIQKKKKKILSYRINVSLCHTAPLKDWCDVYMMFCTDVYWEIKLSLRQKIPKQTYLHEYEIKRYAGT